LSQSVATTALLVKKIEPHSRRIPGPAAAGLQEASIDQISKKAFSFRLLVG
jgi:hypothetical protein